MDETKLTEEQRDKIDRQIAERVLASMPPVNLSRFPLLTVMYARSSLGLGANLEDACPYWRTCNQKENVPVTQCPKPAYRECPHYNTNLLLDILSNRITLDESELQGTLVP